MIELTDKDRADYFKLSYSRVDGLWFMKVEERYGFETALDIDREVWKVLPKMQARMLKAVAGLDGGMDALFECLTTHLTLHDFVFTTERRGSGFEIRISECPWHNLMVKSGREHLSAAVGDAICNAEQAVWASEFGEDIKFELKGQICRGEGGCLLSFSK
jgi:hypothetical protein